MGQSQNWRSTELPVEKIYSCFARSILNLNFFFFERDHLLVLVCDRIFLGNLYIHYVYLCLDLKILRRAYSLIDCIAAKMAHYKARAEN